VVFDPRDPATIFLSDNRQIYQTTDGGKNLAQLLGPQQPWWDSDLVGPQFDSKSPATLYFGSYRSADGGEDWDRLGLDPIALAIDPQNPDTLYGAPQTAIDLWSTSVTQFRSRVQKSMDGGKSWTALGREWQAYYISALAVDPRNSGVIYAETAGFQCDFMDCPNDYFDPSSDLARDNLGLFQSTDGGANWTKLNLPDYRVYPAYPRFLGLDPQGAIYVQTATKLLRSADNGTTWIEVTTSGLRGLVTVLAFDAQDANHLFAGTAQAGVFEIHLAN
jgi:photosystem II stability/assembly factor-like uncharacterized protein